jgi:hypothetical protein
MKAALASAFDGSTAIAIRIKGKVMLRFFADGTLFKQNATFPHHISILPLAKNDNRPFYYTRYLAF